MKAFFNLFGIKQPENAQDAIRDSSAHDLAKYQHYEKIGNYVSDGKYKTALKYIQETLDKPSFDQRDDIYVEDAETCIFELWYDKKPSAVIKAYDAMLENENNPIKYLALHNKTEHVASAFTESLHNYPDIETKAALKKAIAFLNSDHPLILEARKNDDDAFVTVLENGCYNIFDDWGDDEDSPEAYTWEEILKEIDKRLS